jgi:YidC/Oxa1 family membrane protein insertase
MKKKITIILILFISLFLLTGCTKVLKDGKQAVVYENKSVRLTLYENILCQPESKGLIKEYNKYKKKVDISKLPKCDKFKIKDSKYEGLWENLFVKPLAWVIVRANKFIGNYGVTIVLLGVLLRLILVPFTYKTMTQSENMKKMQPELDRLNKKYENKLDQESQQKKSMETMQLYKKYKINPLSSCLFAFIQIPLIMAFYEAINRVPVIFEGKLFGLVLGSTPMKAISGGHWAYIIIVILIAGTTFASFYINKNATPQQQGMNPNIMPIMMTGMITFMALNLSVALSLYWIASTLFTIIQNVIVMLIKKGKAD